MAGTEIVDLGEVKRAARQRQDALAVQVPYLEIPMAWPPHVCVATTSLDQQMVAVFSEGREVAEAIEGQTDGFLVELLDLHHAVESAIRVVARDHGTAVLNQAYHAVLSKNAARNYYGPEAEG